MQTNTQFRKYQKISYFYQKQFLKMSKPTDLYASLKPEDFIRGSTPPDIDQQCLDLCRTYIGGSWSLASSTQDINVSRIIGGLSNQLYRVQLSENVPKSAAANILYPEDPRDVTVKLYQSKLPKCYHDDDGERLNDTIILTAMSQEGLGPKVYGVFDGGVIQAYHKVGV